jgi:hypothetical protein
VGIFELIFKCPYRPAAQTIYYGVLAISGVVLLVVGQSWAIGITVAGGGGVLFMVCGAVWRRRHVR